jgi:hypothetical protein
MKIDRTTLDFVAIDAPELVPAVASLMPFSDLFSDEVGIGYEEYSPLCYGLQCDLPLPDEDGSLPGMHWSADIYEDRVEVSRLQKQDGISVIRGTETFSLREFWHLLRKVSQGRTVPMTTASVGSGPSKS